MSVSPIVASTLAIRIAALITCIFPCLASCRLYRRVSNCMLAPDEILLVLSHWRKQSNVLIFGLGNDSPLWATKAHLSRGTVLFVEDDAAWINLIGRRFKALRIEKVQYQTTKSEWASYLSGESPVPDLQLSQEVASRRYEMIFVDGPLGYPEHSPGRMQSLQAASGLVADRGVIVVDDYDRYVDRALADHFLPNRQYECSCLSHRHKTAVFSVRPRNRN